MLHIIITNQCQGIRLFVTVLHLVQITHNTIAQGTGECFYFLFIHNVIILRAKVVIFW